MDLPTSIATITFRFSNILNRLEQYAGPYDQLKHHTVHPLLPFDSGTTSHCSPYHEDFAQLTSIPTREIKGINGSSISTLAIGTIYIKCGKGQRLTLKDALHIPDIRLPLISIGQLSNDGLHASFTATTCDIQHRSKTIAKGSQHGKGLYMLTDHPSVKRINITHAAVMLDTWH